MLLGVGLVAALVAVTKGNDWGWTEPVTLSLLVGGVLVLLAFGAYDLRQAIRWSTCARRHDRRCC